ncbi:hypothetical protein Glove_173g79 [Diversispora epigaea]|uniref:Uncharacterized protein n=1 Tax=Diversispora epigaea TaxID=1348612 RepID=A0A397IP88_9GLOM|nr:hypothetical protein Glove_173g79 [Diversispora epigaea]
MLSENSDTSSDEDELDLENSSECDQTNDKMFTVINFGKQIGAVNLWINYMYRGEQLENMCFYDYVSTGRATKVDLFLFLGGEKRCDENCDHNIIHPQHLTHIQIHWSRESDKITTNADDLMEETVLDRHLHQVVRENPEIAKIRRIERSVMKYDDTGDTEILIDQYDFDVDNSILLNPYEIMRTGLRDAKFVNDVMFHLYVKDKFNNKKIVQQNFREEADVKGGRLN